ncbi:MAG: hypothetical protein E6614_36105, partial [Bradyrhizobium sp.]|nr:hypothetical protein [Bradyrhizobium sp.]
MKLPTFIVAALAGLAALALAGPPTAWAGPAAALVEDVQGEVAGAELMDYVAPGQVIKLGPDGAVVMSYLKSCRRESVSGAGSVTVGP